MIKRINGFIDLDEYFYEQTGKYIIHLEDLYDLGLAEPEAEGLYDKFWFAYNNESVLYKDTPENSCASYAELIAEELAKTVRIPSAHYDLATFRGKKGVLSYQFHNPLIEVISGDEILSEYLEKRQTEKGFMLDGEDDDIDYFQAMEELNSLEYIWLALEERYKDRPDKNTLIPVLMTNIVDILIFDVITLQSDRHACNWAIIEDGDNIRVAPLFDNSKLGKLSINDGIRKANLDDDAVVRLTPDADLVNGSPLEVIERFIKLSSSIYHERILQQLDIVEASITGAIQNVEQRVSARMPNDEKEEYINAVLNNIKSIRGLIQPGLKDDEYAKTKR